MWRFERDNRLLSLPEIFQNVSNQMRRRVRLPALETSSAWLAARDCVYVMIGPVIIRNKFHNLGLTQLISLFFKHVNCIINNVATPTQNGTTCA